ncbi:uncharacterized protein LOC124131415 isoform X2 [Haliotis rufescens]|nr:uncharacterized protein LOC124131415 isoform X2 [Haliotis rufescens]XP_046350648.2 uncharacterized protein LOC124131415 isoform X2 [Haliotis rufescens]
MLGENGKAQTGSSNRTVSVTTKRKGARIERSTSQPRTSLPQTVEAVQEQEPTDKSGSDLYEAIPLKTEGSYTTNSTLDLNEQTYRKQIASPEDGTGEDDGELAANVAEHTRESVSWHKYKKQNPQNTSQTNMSDSHHKSKKQDEDTSGHFVTKSSKMKDSSTQTEGYFGVGESGIYFQEVHGPYIQCGPNNSIVNIEVNKDFLSTVKEAGVLTVRDATKPLLSCTWKGNDEKGNEAVKAVKSLWTLQLKELFESMYGQVLSHFSHNLFSPLRELIVDIFKKYDAKLTGIFSGSLLFVFWHADEESAQSMVAGKEVVREMFHQLLLGMGKGEIEFTLDAAVDTSDSMEAAASGKVGGGEEVDADPLASLPLDFDPLIKTLKSSIQQKADKDASKRAKELKEIEKRLQSMETGFKRLQHNMNEQLDSFRGDTEKGRKEIREFTQTVLETVQKKEQEQPSTTGHMQSSSPLEISQFLSMKGNDWSSSAGIHPQVQTEGMAYVVETMRSDPSFTTKSTDKPTPATERNESPSAASPEIAEEILKPQGKEEHVPRHGSTAESSGGDTHTNSSRVEQPSIEEEIASVDKSIPSKQVYEEAEQLLSSMNVASVGRSISSTEVRRLTESVAKALVDDNPPPPRAKSMDTLLCLDVSDSIGLSGLEEVKQIANDFVDGIEDIAEQHGLEENVGVVSLGGGAKVVQQLTNDYGAVRDAIDDLVCHGRSPMFEALMVCVAAIKGRGGVLSVGGAHKIRPRIIFITDGLASNESSETGPDTPSTDHNTKIQLIRLVSEMTPKKHSSTPHPVIWIPVGEADRAFLTSLSKLGDGNIIESKDVPTLCTYYRVQENIGRIFMCVKNNSGDWSNLNEAIEAVAEAFIGNMKPEEKNAIIQEVKVKLERNDTNDVDDDPDGYDKIKELKDLPPLGSRVIRGPDWKYQDQDVGGPGTVINHADDHKLVWVLWDLNDKLCRYRFGFENKYDINVVEDKPRTLKEDELIEVGCRVKRGADWPYQNEDGGPGKTGVVIRKRKDNSVKVRWENGTIQPCRYITQEGKFELEICSSDDPSGTSGQSGLSTSGIPLQDDQEEPDMPTPEKPHMLWQWHDDPGQWRLYNREDNDKLTREFTRKPAGSCILQKNGRSFRVLFGLMQEKDVDSGIRHDVKRLVVSDEERDEYIAKEISMNDGHFWT